MLLRAIFKELGICCGLGCTTDDPNEEYQFLCLGHIEESPYDLTTRLLETNSYTRVTAIPLWRLPQFPRAWKTFVERNINPYRVQEGQTMPGIQAHEGDEVAPI